MTYRWNNKPWQVFINATTGEVQGERPWSVWKITFAVLAAIAAIAGIWFWIDQSQPQ
jgi:branched-subunit amino acid ABC-type transport system permease component